MQDSPWKNAAPVSVARALANRRIIDVRSPAEFVGELSHIDGAVLVPLGSLATVAESWDRRESLVLVCRSGRRSTRAARLLVEAGFTDVPNLAGGMLAWIEGSLPTAEPRSR